MNSDFIWGLIAVGVALVLVWVLACAFRLIRKAMLNEPASSVLAEAERLMMCQQCGAVAPFDSSGHSEEYFCPCGGQYCGCEDCHVAAVGVCLANGVTRGNV